MDVYEAIISRRSTRNYKPDMVEPDKMDRILNAGRFAPSGGNSQSNHFFVITGNLPGAPSQKWKSRRTPT